MPAASYKQESALDAITDLANSVKRTIVPELVQTLKAATEYFKKNTPKENTIVVTTNQGS